MATEGSDSRERVRTLFDSIASGYDRANRLMSLGRDRRWRVLVARRCAIPAGGSALDLCCGTGELSLALARSAPTLRVQGLDWSEEMLALAVRKVAEAGEASRISFIRADATRIPYADRSFDGVTVGWGLRNVPDLVTTIREMHRVLKPGRRAVSIDMGHPRNALVARLYWLFSARFIPSVGGAVSGNAEAYRYLDASARAFVDQRGLAKLFGQAGFVDVRVTNLFGGAVAIVEGRKEQA